MTKDIQFDPKDLSPQLLKDFYQSLLLPRLIEERMLIGLRQGKISKWFSAWGQEGISVGAALALDPDEFICTMHRNLGVFTTRKIPLERLFAQWQGKLEGFTQGRDRSFHFGSHEFKIVGMISHLGAQMGVADGIALAQKLQQSQKATLVFTGDGGTSEGDFHEAMNLAAVWDLPVIIIVENNGWGLSTPSDEQFRCESFADKGIGYGIESISINGNNVLEVYHTIKSYAEDIRKNPRPILIECRTFRMRGHEEASGTKYYPEGLQDKWANYDPVTNFENYLLNQEIYSQDEIDALKEKLNHQIIEAWEKSNSFAKVQPNLLKETTDIYHPHTPKLIIPKATETKEMRLIDAIHDAQHLALKKHPELIFMGQDIAEYGGVFKATDGFVEKFGKDRIRNTPITEAAVLGSALGLSILGKKAMVEMQFSDFVTEGFNQIVNNLAKAHYRWSQCADVVVRMPTGGGVAAGPFHSQSTESWFTHVPGLKVIYPSNPIDAKGLLLAAFEDPNPILFFEHKYLYRTEKQLVPTDYYNLQIGKAKIVKEGNDATIVTFGWGVQMAIQVTKELEYDVEVIDLRTLVPLDIETITTSVKKTGKLLVLHEHSLTGGFGAEISALIAEHSFQNLDAPVMRVGSLDTPVPFDAGLENQYLPWNRLRQKLKKLIQF